jgi:hypothetical protein
MTDMGWSRHVRDEENSAWGGFLLATIADIYGVPAGSVDAERLINRAVYKFTDCGAWCRFDEQGIMVGTIVEGSDAEYAERIDTRGLDYDEESEQLIRQRFFAALQRCDEFAVEHFASEEGEA